MAVSVGAVEFADGETGVRNVLVGYKGRTRGAAGAVETEGK